MNSIALLALFVAAATAASVMTTLNVENSFAAWKLKYNKNYLSAV